MNDLSLQMNDLPMQMNNLSLQMNDFPLQMNDLSLQMNDFPLQIINYMKTFLDRTTFHNFNGTNKKINTISHELFHRLTPSRKNYLLENNSSIKSDVYCKYLSKQKYTKYFNKMIELGIINNDISIFIKELIKTDVFYVGGSFALIYNLLLNKINFRITDYISMDIDIYPITTMTPNSVKNVLNKIIKKYIKMKQIKCKIVIKNYIMNIYFQNNILIQIILKIKSSMDTHMVNIDLPITHFTIGYEKIYMTKLAEFAMHKKINIINKVYHKQTYNRILKYLDRGFYTVCSLFDSYELADNERIVGFFDCESLYSKTITKFEIDIPLIKFLEVFNKSLNYTLEFKDQNDLPIPDALIHITSFTPTTTVRRISCDCLSSLCKYCNLHEYDPFYQTIINSKTTKREHINFIFSDLFKTMIIMNLVKSINYTIIDNKTDTFKGQDYEYIITTETTREITEYEGKIYTKYKYPYSAYKLSYRYYKNNWMFLPTESTKPYPTFFPITPKQFIKIKQDIFFT